MAAILPAIGRVLWGTTARKAITVGTGVTLAGTGAYLGYQHHQKEKTQNFAPETQPTLQPPTQTHINPYQYNTMA